MLFAGLGSVHMVKNCDLGLENAALGLQPRAAFSSPRSQFVTIRTSQPANNIYTFKTCLGQAKFESCLPQGEALIQVELFSSPAGTVPLRGSFQNFQQAPSLFISDSLCPPPYPLHCQELNASLSDYLNHLIGFPILNTI